MKNFDTTDLHRFGKTAKRHKKNTVKISFKQARIINDLSNKTYKSTEPKDI